MSEQAPARLLIVDQSLRDLVGHHFEYDLAVAQSAAQHHLSASVLAHESFDHFAAFGSISAIPWFSQTFYDADKSPFFRMARGLAIRLPSTVRAPLIALASPLLRRQRTAAPAALPVFGEALKSYLIREAFQRHDHVLIHTVSMAELNSALAALAGWSAGPKLHVVLRRDADEPGIRSGHWATAADAFARVEGDAALAERVAFYTDSTSLSAQYSEIAPGIAFRVLPVPYPPSEPALLGQDRKPGPLRITYVGDARLEKGYHLLPGLMAELGTTLLDGRTARLVAQSNAAMSMEDQPIIRARKGLARYPASQVELIVNPLSVSDFNALLAQADIVIFPYDAEKYRRRSSGILVQALAAGKPVVVPAQTWLADSAPPGAAVQFSTSDEFNRAVAIAIESYASLSDVAQRQAQIWRDFHTGSNLVKALCESAELAGQVEPRRTRFEIS
ncbi:glycosyltransferase [Bosea sp. BK604]|uniref:glycosyltransferase n=1 Tax=Bosea sp. BK604 TaxID=2512180 RepID=UPI00104DE331|nr:glycosyltransferase [Bosea sp. BK604]TCR70038.1 glycosyltransferase involved in cell wall biosynthesis [Bosea sp. BK604]